MKVRVDPDTCAGFGICVGICPEVFELHADGYALVMVDEVPAEFEDLVNRAADQCPSRAITVSGEVGR